MNDLDRSIIATLAYFAAFAWPLTLIEISERLVPARRLGGRDDLASMGMILERLERMGAMDMVLQEDGLYIMKGVDSGFGARRIEQEKIWAQKWRGMLRKARWLQVVPYVRGIYASGSLALGNMSAQSDWDIFVVAQSGRLYTARIGLVLVAWILRALRTKHDVIASDKFCFNHYLTTESLNISHRSLYTAQGLAVLVPVYDPDQYLPGLWHANEWIAQYRPMLVRAQYTRRSVRYSRVLALLKRLGEVLLPWAEPYLRRWQQHRIARDPATRQLGGRVIATDRQIEFHPRSFEAVALARYNAALERFGLGVHREQDSGLTK